MDINYQNEYSNNLKKELVTVGGYCNGIEDLSLHS